MRKVVLALGLFVAACGGKAESLPAAPPQAVGHVTPAAAAALANPPEFYSYPEGPLFRDGRLMIAEMGADRVRVWTLTDTSPIPSAWTLPACGPTALAPYGEGYVVLCHLAGALAVVDANGQELRRIGPEAGVPIRNPNDGASDLAGGVYFSDPGDFYRPRQPVGRVVWLDPQGRLHEVARGLNYPNGVYVVEEGGTRFAYVSEHFSRRVLRYRIADDGTFADRTVWATFPLPTAAGAFTYDQAGPDGLERAPNGDWFVAIYGEGRVMRLNAGGEIVGQIDTPFQYVTNMVVLPEGQIVIVGPAIHDRPPFRGGLMVVRPADFAAFPR